MVGGVDGGVSQARNWEESKERKSHSGEISLQRLYRVFISKSRKTRNRGEEGKAKQQREGDASIHSLSSCLKKATLVVVLD